MSFVPVVPVVAKPNGKTAQPTYAQLAAKIAELEAKAAIANAPSELTIRIKDGVNKDGIQLKGTVCVYGLGRFPVPLYAEQWERLLAGCNPAPGSPAAHILAACKDPRASRKVR